MEKYKSKILISSPLLEGNEKKYLAECVDTGWISSQGRFVQDFEKAMALRCNRKYAVAVSSGTAALELAVRALDIGLGDEVITSDFSIISCTNSILKNQAKPVLVDCHKDGFNIDVDKIEEEINSKTKALLIPHIYGLPSNMKKVMSLAKKHDLRIIEDAAEMHGQTYNQKPCGSFGDISIFSFYVNKLVTTGEGGMLLTDNEEVYKKASSLRNHSFMEGRRFVHDDIGFNYRMTNIQAAIGLAQIEQLDNFIKRKREIGQYYLEKLSHLSCLNLPQKRDEYSENIFWSFPIVINNKKLKASELIAKLGELNIEAKEMFWPLHDQPIYNKMNLFDKNSKGFPNSKFFSEYGLNLPSGLSLTNEEIDFIAKALSEVLKDYE